MATQMLTPRTSISLALRAGLCSIALCFGGVPKSDSGFINWSVAPSASAGDVAGESRSHEYRERLSMHFAWQLRLAARGNDWDSSEVSRWVDAFQAGQLDDEDLCACTLNRWKSPDQAWMGSPALDTARRKWAGTDPERRDAVGLAAIPALIAAGAGGAAPSASNGGGGAGPTPILRPITPESVQLNAGETKYWGFIAFHKNGMDKVRANVNNSAWVDCADYEYEPTTGIWAYWFSGAASTFSADGKLNLYAEAIPAGTVYTTRVYTHNLIANGSGTLVKTYAYVDQASPSGTPVISTTAATAAASPYETIYEAVRALQGATARESIIRVRPRNNGFAAHYWGEKAGGSAANSAVHASDPWMTIEPDPDVSGTVYVSNAAFVIVDTLATGTCSAATNAGPTTLTLTRNGVVQATLTLATYPTIADLVVAINAVSGYQVTEVHHPEAASTYIAASTSVDLNVNGFGAQNPRWIQTKNNGALGGVRLERTRMVNLNCRGAQLVNTAQAGYQLWAENCVFRGCARSENHSGVASTDWPGGRWFTGCTFENMGKPITGLQSATADNNKLYRNCLLNEVEDIQIMCTVVKCEVKNLFPSPGAPAGIHADLCQIVCTSALVSNMAYYNVKAIENTVSCQTVFWEPNAHGVSGCTDLATVNYAAFGSIGMQCALDGSHYLFLNSSFLWTNTTDDNRFVNFRNHDLFSPAASTAVTITRSGTTATVSHALHGFSTGTRVAITGVTSPNTAYNGGKTITVVDANTYTYTVVDTVATPATGSPVAALSLPTSMTNILLQNVVGNRLLYAQIGSRHTSAPTMTLMSDAVVNCHWIEEVRNEETGSLVVSTSDISSTFTVAGSGGDSPSAVFSSTTAAPVAGSRALNRVTVSDLVRDLNDRLLSVDAAAKPSVGAVQPIATLTATVDGNAITSGGSAAATGVSGGSTTLVFTVGGPTGAVLVVDAGSVAGGLSSMVPPSLPRTLTAGGSTTTATFTATLGSSPGTFNVGTDLLADFTGTVTWSASGGALIGSGRRRRRLSVRG